MEDDTLFPSYTNKYFSSIFLSFKSSFDSNKTFLNLIKASSKNLGQNYFYQNKDVKITSFANLDVHIIYGSGVFATLRKIVKQTLPVFFISVEIPYFFRSIKNLFGVLVMYLNYKFGSRAIYYWNVQLKFRTLSVLISVLCTSTLDWNKEFSAIYF